MHMCCNFIDLRENENIYFNFNAEYNTLSKIFKIKKLSNVIRNKVCSQKLNTDKKSCLSFIIVIFYRKYNKNYLSLSICIYYRKTYILCIYIYIYIYICVCHNFLK